MLFKDLITPREDTENWLKQLTDERRLAVESLTSCVLTEDNIYRLLTDYATKHEVSLLHLRLTQLEALRKD